MRLTRCVALFVMAIASVSPSFAWGTKGHTWTCENAVALLPDGPLKEYIRSQLGRIAVSSLTPDFQWKDGSNGTFEKPNHYIDLENIAPNPEPTDLPRTRIEASRLYTRLGLKHSDGGFLPWRIEEMYLELVNAFKTRPDDIALCAGALSHYAADATQPLHTTIHYDGRTDRREDGRKFLQGIHVDYEITFVEDRNIEFRQSSLALARPARKLDDVFGEAVRVIFAAHSKVDGLYAVAEAHQGEGKYAAWERELGAMTRGQLAEAATFTASLWLTAWEEAGRPD